MTETSTKPPKELISATNYQYQQYFYHLFSSTFGSSSSVVFVTVPLRDYYYSFMSIILDKNPTTKSSNVQFSAFIYEI